MRAARARAAWPPASRNTLLEDVRRNHVTGARRVEGIERRQHDGAIGVVDGRGDDGEAVLPRGSRRRAYERRSPGCAVAGERRREERNRGVAEPSEGGGRAARRARLLDRRDRATDDLQLDAVVAHEGIQRRGSHRRVAVVQECDQHARVRDDDSA